MDIGAPVREFVVEPIEQNISEAPVSEPLPREVHDERDADQA
jgi:hypothetical protein